MAVPRFVIMRHDVEQNLNAAEAMAVIDSEAGVKSTFFLLQSGDYNCFSECGARIVRRILSLGHDIGLHYDGGLLERLELDPATAVRSQIAMLESFFSTKVSAISAHMPARSPVSVVVPHVVDVYSIPYCHAIKYVSDSLQRWREGVVTSLLEKHDKIHLLTHECNWSESGLGWDEIMLRDAQDRFDRHRSRTLETIERFREGLASRAQRDAQFMDRLLSGSPQPARSNMEPQ